MFMMYTEHFPRNKEAVYAFLEPLALSDETWSMIKLSFRTRAKETNEWVISFQFRIMPEKISAAQECHIDAIREEIATKLALQHPSLLFDVIVQVAPCCGSQCFGCREFK